MRFVLVAQQLAQVLLIEGHVVTCRSDRLHEVTQTLMCTASDDDNFAGAFTRDEFEPRVQSPMSVVLTRPLPMMNANQVVHVGRVEALVVAQLVES